MVTVMAALRGTSPQWKTTIIVSSALRSHETCRQLRAQPHRIRFSDSIESGVFVFPLSGTAFLLVGPEDLPEPFEEFQLIERIKNFLQVHRNCFLLLHDPFNDKKDVRALLQSRFFGSSLRILPVHTYPDLVKGMLTIAKATSKPHVDRIRDRMSLARARVIETSPKCEMLRKML
ncbi:protein SPO16 homolog [Melanotaenia boesemani]|uniref:protein SPO16 homolog n=1 Tax=Melanotaenia boesemani TaxID=1250792 RepID=UPI001C053F4E|nr:protein SPO16 homolog [Melanotaenia boesemani]